MKERIPKRPSRALSPGADLAFILTEMLVVIAITGALAALLLPGLGIARQSARSTQCLAGLKQLQLAWILYARDNNDFVVPNKSRSQDLIQRAVAPSWVLGNAKWDASATNLTSGLLFSYAGSQGVYRCPDDLSNVKQAAAPANRIRSYSLSIGLGGDLVGKGMQGSTTTESRFKAKLAAVQKPAGSFAFLDEHQDSIDDGIFGAYDAIHWTESNAAPELKTWLEMPSDRHNRGCNFSFVDGHAEHWRWKWPKVFEDYDQPPANALDQADLQRLQAALPY